MAGREPPVYILGNSSSLDECLNTAYTMLRRQLLRPPQKKICTSADVLMTLARLRLSYDKQAAGKTIRVLLDSSSSASLVAESLVQDLDKDQKPESKWHTVAGAFRTTALCDVQLSLPEFYTERLIKWRMHVHAGSLRHYDMIVGRDLLEELGIVIDFKRMQVIWDDAYVPMRQPDANIQTTYHVNDSKSLAEATERVKKILDAKYEPADLQHEVSKCTHLSSEEQSKLLALLNRHRHLLDVSLGLWNDAE